MAATPPPVLRAHASPHFSVEEIPVDFVVLHYTGCGLERTLEIFEDPASKVCAHFVLAENGGVYDLDGTLEGPVHRGAHAGVSRFALGGTEYQAFNHFSVGIEIVNLNGNYFAYSDAQYHSLNWLAGELKRRHPALRDPERFVGHEHIAGFRGKADPGLRFDWARFFAGAFPGASPPARPALCNPADADFLKKAIEAAGAQKQDPLFWSRLSSELEKRVAGRA